MKGKQKQFRSEFPTNSHPMPNQNFKRLSAKKQNAIVAILPYKQQMKKMQVHKDQLEESVNNHRYENRFSSVKLKISRVFHMTVNWRKAERLGSIKQLTLRMQPAVQQICIQVSCFLHNFPIQRLSVWSDMMSSHKFRLTTCQ